MNQFNYLKWIQLINNQSTAKRCGGYFAKTYQHATCYPSFFFYL